MANKTVPDLAARLDEIIDSFSTAAIKCCDTFFARPCSVLEPWHRTDDIDCNTDRIVTIGYANPTYQAITAIGINNEGCSGLFGKPIHDDEYLDIFGEFANNYCALLMDRDDFTERFGVLYQSVPVLYSRRMPFLPFISGVRGRIAIEGGAIINAGFSIKQREVVK